MKIFFSLIFLTCFALPSIGNEKFSIVGDTLIYDTSKASDEALAEINWEDSDILAQMLLENPDIKTLQLNSFGGLIEAAVYMSDIIIDYELDTHIVGECISSCAILFIAGEKRTIQRGSWLGFHQSSWDKVSIEDYYENNKDEFGWENAFEYSSWIYKDTQKQIFRDMEYLLERGVEPLFAIKTMKADSKDMWYPRRKELEAARVISE